MRLSNNLAAFTAFNSFNKTTNKLEQSIKQLSTGLRINSAADDAAGLAISEALGTQSTGLTRAISNAQDGISLLQTAEGALGETNSMLQRMRELAVEAANDTLTSQDRNFIQMEIEQLRSNIDKIANTTQFNTLRLLDGSCCGMCASTDTTTKGYIRGAIEAEGNYRIEIKAEPGAAQVQKSTIFKVKHKNVITNGQFNAASGIGNVSINDMPAGNYHVTATKAGGGESEVTFKSSATVKIKHANDSDTTETLYIRLTGKNSSGNEVSWPYYYSMPSYDSSVSSVDGKYYYRTTIQKTDVDETSVAERVKALLNNRTITMATNNSGSGAVNFELTADIDDDGNCIVSTTSQEGTLSDISFITKPGATLEISPLTREYNNTVKTTELTGKVEDITIDSAKTLSITIQNGINTNTIPLSISAGSDQNAIAKAIREVNQRITVGGKEVTVKGETVTSGDSAYYRLTATAGDETVYTISTSIDGVTLFPTSSNTAKTTYDTKYNGTVTKGNTSENIEKFSIRAHHNSGYYRDFLTIEVSSGTSEEDIAKLIADEVGLRTVTVNGDSFLVESEYSGSGEDFSLKATGASYSVSFSIVNITAEGEAATQIADNTFDVEEEYSHPTSAITTLTGFYGNDKAVSSLEAQVNNKTQNNASILFEVVASAVDPITGDSTITLSARSNVLSADGTPSRYSDEKIVFSTANNTVKLGSLLGEADGNFSLTLDPELFEIGNKFVYNVSGNGTSSTPVDTSLYIEGTQDKTWPSIWNEKDDGITYDNSTLYFNVNSDAVSNRVLLFRNYYLNSDNGRVIEGELNMTINDKFGQAAKNFPEPPEEPDDEREEEITLASFDSNYVGKVADGATKLRDLEQFWTKSGVFMLEEAQTITISQNDGKKATITLDAYDTLNDLKCKLNDAISIGLDQGRCVAGGDANKFVSFVENVTDQSGIETVEGTFLIRSLIPGTDGELTFSSSYGELIDKLGFNTVQGSREGSYNVSVYDAHSGTVIASNVKTSGNVLQGVIDKNIDVEFDPMAGVVANWSESDKNFILIPKQKAYTTNLHVVRNNIRFQTGSNEGDELQLDIGDMSCSGLGIDGINLTTHDRASKSITILDNAIKKVSSQRSKIGVYQNALEHTIESLTITGENLALSESRIRDVDMSKAALELIKWQVLNQSGSAMLAQANQTTRSVLNLLK